MDELAVTFAPLHARAAATHDGPPLDRISVRDYVRAADIGAFRSEQGVAQRIRFNVVLEVRNHAAAASDDVDQVVSYDSITEAIDAAIAAERADLLETLAERVARGCLSDPRVVRVFVRLEKLDRIPGALGVEIVRTRLPERAARLRAVAAEGAGTGVPQRPLVVHVGARALADAGAWAAALAALDRPAVLCTGSAGLPLPPASGEAAQRIALLAIEQAAWALAGSVPGLEVVGTRTELEHAFAVRQALPVWAPARMVAAAADGTPEPGDGPGLALWLARRIDAAGLVVIGATAPAVGAGLPVHLLAADGPRSFDGIG